jgi:hypothetical protein
MNKKYSLIIIAICLKLLHQFLFNMKRFIDKTYERFEHHLYLYKLKTASNDFKNRLKPYVSHWCRRPESNRYDLLGPQDFKSCASASSATPANTFTCDKNNYITYIEPSQGTALHIFMALDAVKSILTAKPF